MSISINQTEISCQEILKEISSFSKNPEKKYQQDQFIDYCKEFTFQVITQANSLWKSKNEPICYLKRNKIKTGKNEEKVVTFLYDKYFRYRKPCYAHYKWISNKLDILKVNLIRTLKNLEKKGLIKRITWRDYRDKNYRTIIFPINFSSDTTLQDTKKFSKTSDTRGGITCDNKYLKLQEKAKTYTLYKYNIIRDKNLNSINNNLEVIGFNSKQLLRNGPSKNEGPLSCFFLNKGDKKSMTKRYKLKSKPESLLPNNFDIFVNTLKDNHFDLNSLSFIDRNTFLSIMSFKTGIDFEKVFRISENVKVKNYFKTMIKLREMFIELFINNCLINWNLCEDIIKKWNIIANIQTEYLQKCKINLNSSAFIHAATAITYSLYFKANSEIHRIYRAIERLNQKNNTYKNPIYKSYCTGKKINVTMFFGNFNDEKYLEGYFENNEDLYEAYTDYMFTKKRRISKYSKVHKIFKKWLVDILFDGDEEKSKPILLRFNFKISDMLDKLIEESKNRKMEGLKLFSSTGHNQPALLYYYLFHLEENKYKFFKKKPHIFEIIDYVNWLRFVDKIVHNELGYYDFWKKQANDSN